MEKILSFITPRICLDDFPPTELGWVTRHNAGLDLDEWRGLHLDLFDLPVVDQCWRTGLARKPLEIEEGIYSNVDFPAQPSAPPRVCRWPLLPEDEDAHVKHPPVIRYMHDLAKNIVVCVPDMGQRWCSRGVRFDFF